jgi:hypothetical protein
MSAAKARWTILLAGMLTLAGCASVTGFPDDVLSPKDDLAQTRQYFAPTVVSDYAALTGEAVRRAKRDEVVYGRIHAYDVQYHAFLKALSREAGGSDITGDFLALALNGLGATVGDAGTKAALSAASGGVLGAQGDINKDLFYQKTLPAIVAQMEAQRIQVRAVIEKGLASPDASYSLPQAIVDLDQYQIAGSLPGALNGISQDAGTKTAQAEKDISFSRDQSFVAALQPAISIGEKISSLTDAQALTLAKAMDPILKTRPQNIQDLVAGIDPNNVRLTDGGKAKIILRQWSIMDQRDSASQKQWTDAIAAAAKT